MERLTHIRVRRDEQGTDDWERGDIGIPYQETQPHLWYVRCPECGGRAHLGNHTITEHEDGTITISPSLLCPGVERGHCTAHYFVERNQIRWC